MSVDLVKLVSQFRAFHDKETDLAWFRTLVPWVAPTAGIAHPRSHRAVRKLARRLVVYCHFVSKRQ